MSRAFAASVVFAIALAGLSAEAPPTVTILADRLLELTGDTAGALAAYRAAAERAGSLPQQRYLNARAARLGRGRRGAGRQPASVGSGRGGTGVVTTIEVTVCP